MKANNIAAAIITALSLCGCEPSQGEKLYNAAFQQEQQNPYLSVESYRKVIAAEPKSPWAQKAQQRIDALLQRRAADDAAHEARRARRAAEDK